MEDDEIVVACTAVILASIGAAVEVSEAEKKKRKNKTWINEYIRNRDNIGAFNTLLPELFVGGKYVQYLRMDVEVFEEVYMMVEPLIIRKTTRVR